MDVSELESAFRDMGIDEENIKAEVIPGKCLMCLNNTICNPLISFITLYKIGIKLQVDSCPYFRSASSDQ
jgi:hypothetical protein